MVRRRTVYRALLGLALLASVATPAAAGSTVQRAAPTTRFYDARGNPTGTASTYGNQTKF
jgi:hypothetical protein